MRYAVLGVTLFTSVAVAMPALGQKTGVKQMPASEGVESRPKSVQKSAMETGLHFSGMVGAAYAEGTLAITFGGPKIGLKTWCRK